jgi:thiamine transport system permease protein
LIAGVALPFDLWSRTNWGLLVEIIGFSFFQASVSATLAVLLGTWGAQFLLSIDRALRLRRFIEALVLLPSFIPPIAMAFGYIKIFPGTRGLGSVIFVGALMNVGIVAVALKGLACERLSRPAKVAELMGVRPAAFLTKVAVPILLHQVMLLWFFVFALNFSAFTIPVLLGGSRASTLEVFIYQKFVIEGDLASAWLAGFLQFTCTIAIAQIFFWSRPEKALDRRSASQSSERQPSVFWDSKYLVSRFGAIPLLLPLAILLTSLSANFTIAFSQLRQSSAIQAALVEGLLGSLQTSGLTALGVLALLVALIYFDPRERGHRFLLSYCNPSVALFGMLFVVIWPRSTGLTEFKFAIALTLIFSPALFRIYIAADHLRLRGQIDSALLMGASQWLIVRRVVLPQLWSGLSKAMALAGFWAWGDYSLTAILADRDQTLALVFRSLMGSYRFELATLVLWIILICGALSYAILRSVKYVYRN